MRPSVIDELVLRATSTTRWRIRHAEKFVGTHVVGPREKLPAGKPWTNAPLTIKVPFPAARPSRPVVVACALQDPKHPAPCPDTLALAVISVANTDLTVNIYRTDYAGADDTTSGRGQNPHLPCIAETPA